jgi:DNA-binding LacI/PurR family transcriptional regulator
MGMAAASMVATIVDEQPLPHHRVILTTELVVRASTTVPAGASRDVTAVGVGHA